MIALLHPAPAWGAVERYVGAIARGLHARGEEAVLVYPDSPELLPFAATGLRTETFPPDLSAPRLALRLRRFLRDARPRVVHVTDVWPAAQVAARLARAPRVLVTHHTPELPRADNALGRLLWRTAWRGRPEVIYTSESDRERDGRGDLTAHVIELGIDLERFARGEPALRVDGPLVGNVARLAEQKGHADLLEALAELPDVRAAIVGDGPLRAGLEAQARELGLAGRVTFTGERDDVPDLLASMDVFAFPSLFEGLCLAVIEAQAAGVPVVATPVGGIRETVVEGETGVVVPVNDPQALAAGIRRVLADPPRARAMAEEARRRVFERFSEARMVERTLELYG
jgi:glycosyltransferase involved in cell wall biosynthesis